jgi:hypothetical protein
MDGNALLQISAPPRISMDSAKLQTTDMAIVRSGLLELVAAHGIIHVAVKTVRSLEAFYDPCASLFDTSRLSRVAAATCSAFSRAGLDFLDVPL